MERAQLEERGAGGKQIYIYIYTYAYIHMYMNECDALSLHTLQLTD